jgi:hypothetical protein
MVTLCGPAADDKSPPDIPSEVFWPHHEIFEKRPGF